jgi:hypothetical protein
MYATVYYSYYRMLRINTTGTCRSPTHWCDELPNKWRVYTPCLHSEGEEDPTHLPVGTYYYYYCVCACVSSSTRQFLS